MSEGRAAEVLVHSVCCVKEEGGKCDSMFSCPEEWTVTDMGEPGKGELEGGGQLGIRSLILDTSVSKW